MENSASKKESKLMYLDSVRGIASLAVVLSHLSLIYFIYLHNFSGGAIPDTYPVQKYLHDSFWGFFY
ncbi:hypothetical protein, partial [Serratia marcescens]